MTESDPVTRLNAALEGRYRIERELGEGREGGVFATRSAGPPHDPNSHPRKASGGSPLGAPQAPADSAFSPGIAPIWVSNVTISK